MKIGTAEAIGGEVVYGSLEVTELPTGQTEQIPIVIVDGDEPGPTVWVTAGIHPDEITGIAVAQDFIDWLTETPLAGTVVCAPVLNPAGLRVNQRTSYYHDHDPNRYFGREDADGGLAPRVQELIDGRLYESIVETADAVVALHTSRPATHPYTIRSRVPYGECRDEAAAADLSDRVDAIATAFGLPVVTQFGADERRARSLHQALTEVATRQDGIPAITPELGGRYVVDEDVRRAGVAGLTNVLSVLEMVSDPIEPGTTYSLSFDGRHKRHVNPRTNVAGLVRYRVSEGAHIEPGDAVADIVSPDGRVKTTVESDCSGFVLSRMEGAAVYENDPLLDLATPDDEPIVVSTSD